MRSHVFDLLLDQWGEDKLEQIRCYYLMKTPLSDRVAFVEKLRQSSGALRIVEAPQE